MSINHSMLSIHGKQAHNQEGETPAEPMFFRDSGSAGASPSQNAVFKCALISICAYFVAPLGPAAIGCTHLPADVRSSDD